MRNVVERPSTALLVAAFAAVYVVWGSTYLAIKFAIETLPPFLMAGARFLIAGFILYVWARARGAERPSWLHWRTSLIVGALLLLIGNGGVVTAEHYIASGLAALLVATEPLWVVLLNWARPGGARPTGKVMLGLLTGFAGVWLLVGGTGMLNTDQGYATLFGAVLVIVAALSWAGGSLYSLHAPVPRSPLLASGMQMLAGGALLLVAGTVTNEWTRFDLSDATPRSILAFLYLVVFGSIVGFTAYSWLLRVTTPARASTYAYVNPVSSVLLGWWLANEPLQARTLLAAAVIVFSVALITSHGKQKEAGADEKDERLAQNLC